jgi:hypothetical protein
MGMKLQQLGNLVLLACLFVAALPYVAQAGFGVSPPLVREERLVPGITLDRVVYLVQGTPDRDVPVEIIVDSSVKEWITFPQGNPITIPKGVQQYPLAISIAVPPDADLGVYKGTIRLTAVPEKADEAGEVAVALGGLIELDLTVGNNVIYDLSVKIMKILDIKEGDDPAVMVTFINNGNTPVTPDTATFELFNKFGEIRLAYAESEAFEKVPAFSENQQKVTFPIDVHVAPGEYWGHVKVYKDKKPIGELRTVFNATERSFTETYMEYAPYALGALVVLVVIWLAFAMGKRGGRRYARTSASR